MSWVGDGGVSGVSLSIMSSSNDKNGETVGNGGIWLDGSSNGSNSVSDVGKGWPDSTLLFTLIRSRWFSPGRRWWVSTNGHSWLGFDNAIPGGVGSWALDPFGPGERVTLSRGLVNQQEGETLGEKNADSKQKSKNDVEESICSGHFKKSKMPRSGEWVSNGKKLLIISVYAPQELTEKKMLWDYLSNVMSNWEGEVVVMGDFNEVRNKDERSCKEMMNNRKRSLKAELAEFDFIIDKGEVEADVVNIRNEVVKLLQDVEKIHVTPRQWRKLRNAT
uniref:RNA-directed DNA polymerase, eukaryota n=1 Tax=Tanacetum cinerariifolium TaxID=118510 RepID=A0A6L2KK50_TANCI|nr:RNA-directed DNA polymerase, eukaryota [Tanacetum cinerariifolium]